jgi:hypothetical protein
MRHCSNTGRSLHRLAASCKDLIISILMYKCSCRDVLLFCNFIKILSNVCISSHLGRVNILLCT